MKSVCGSCLVSASGGRRINLVLLKQSVAEVASLERHLSLRGVFWRRNRSAHSFPQVSLTAPEVSFSLDTHTHAHTDAGRKHAHADTLPRGAVTDAPALT